MSLERILIADDNEYVQRALMRTLDRWECALALDVSSARIVLETTRIDLVVTDFAMPGGGGLALLAISKRLVRKRPVLLLTGSFDFLHKDEIELFDAYLPKPTDSELLVATIEGLLKRRHFDG